MPQRWNSVIIDCHDIAAQARWWARVLGWQIIFETDDEVVIVPRYVTEEFLSATPSERVGPGLVFVPVPEDEVVKNRLHIDLAPQLSDRMVESLFASGASRVHVGHSDDVRRADEVGHFDQHASQATWVVLADPEGNEFSVLWARGS